MSRDLTQSQIDAVVDALLLPDKKRKERYTTDPTTGIEWSDKQRKYFLMTGGHDPCKPRPSQTVEVREGESEITLTLPKIPEGYDLALERLIKETLQFCCHVVTYGPCHPANLKQFEMFLEKNSVEF
jgi:hypothetical protein